MKKSIKVNPVHCFSAWIALSLSPFLCQPLVAQQNLAPVVTSPTEAKATVNTPFSYTIQANRSATSFTASGLPSGLRLDTATGKITGSPLEQGEFNFAIGARNSFGTSVTNLSLQVYSRLSRLISADQVLAQVNQPFFYEIHATGNPTSVLAQALPAGLILDTKNRIISGTPRSAGTFNVTLTINNNFGSAAEILEIRVRGRTPRFLSPTYLRVARNESFALTLKATNDPFYYAATNLPTGVALDQNSGILQGSTAIVGERQINLEARNSFGTTTTPFTLEVVYNTPILRSPGFTTGRVLDPFLYHLVIENPVNQIQATNLPPGLTLDPAVRAISGKPSAAGTYNTTLSLINSTGTIQAPLQIEIAPLNADVPVITSPLQVIAESGKSFHYQFSVSGELDSLAVVGLPAGLDYDASTRSLAGTIIRTDTYYLEATATNAEGVGSARMMLKVVPPTDGIPQITNQKPLRGSTGDPFSGAITTAGFPTQFDSSGLPSGLFIHPQTGLITGTPESTGTTNASITATNGVGSGQAEIEIIITEDPPSIFADDPDLGGGWKSNSSLGLLNDSTFPWIYQNTLGYLYVSAMDQTSIWLFTPGGSGNLDLGWLWTSRDAFPYLFSNNLGDWYYYVEGSENPRYFYNFASAQFLSF